MSLSYSNLPVYIGAAGIGSIPQETSAYVPATQATVNYNTNHIPQRKLGSTIDSSNQYGFAGALTADINVNCILQDGMHSGFDFLKAANQEDFVTISIGTGNYFNKCYATDVTVNISPYAPVTLNTRFVSLDPPTQTQISGDPSPYSGMDIPFTGDDVAYGHTCSVSDAGNLLNDVQSDISFSRKYARTPVFEIGSVNASTMLLDGIDEELRISSTGLNTLINFSGEELTGLVRISIQGAGVGMSDPIIHLISFESGARVLSEDYSIEGGNTLATTTTIKQTIL